MKKNGFTLLEMLMALATLGVVLMVAVSTFLTVLTKSAKVKVVKAVESDGKYALRVMEGMIRNAREIVDNSNLTPGFDPQVCESSEVEGASMPQIKILNPPGSEWGDWTEFICFDGDYIGIDSSVGGLRLTSPEVKLELGTCGFDCFPGGLEEPDRVTIRFSLSQAGLSADLPIEEESTAVFESTITLRNYQ